MSALEVCGMVVAGMAIFMLGLKAGQPRPPHSEKRLRKSYEAGFEIGQRVGYASQRNDYGIVDRRAYQRPRRRADRDSEDHSMKQAEDISKLRREVSDMKAGVPGGAGPGPFTPQSKPDGD